MDNSDYGVYHYGSKLMSYHDRLIDICERDGVDFEGRIEGVDGQAHPLVQNFDTSKFRSLNL